MKRGEPVPLRDALAAAKAAGPLADNGGDRRSDAAADQPHDVRLKSYGNAASYLARRLLRDHPGHFEKLEAGDFASVRAAAIAAGIVKVPSIFAQLERPVEPKTRRGLDLESLARLHRDFAGKGKRPYQRRQRHGRRE